MVSRSRARRCVATAVALVAAGSMLSACSGQSEYCKAVEKDADSLNSFGKTRTDAAYARYASVFRDVAKVAPEVVAEDWTSLADATVGVVAAQKSVGLKLEDMTDTAKVKALKSAQLKELNAAYEAFNATTDQRTAVVKNVEQECSITLA